MLPGFHLNLAKGFSSLLIHVQMDAKAWWSGRRGLLWATKPFSFSYTCSASSANLPQTDWPTWHSSHPEWPPHSCLCVSVSVWGSPYSVLMTLKLPRNIPFCLCWELQCFWIVKYLWIRKQSPHYVCGSGSRQAVEGVLPASLQQGGDTKDS